MIKNKKNDKDVAVQNSDSKKKKKDSKKTEPKAPPLDPSQRELNKIFFQLLEYSRNDIFIDGNTFFIDGSTDKHDQQSIQTKRDIYVDLDPLDEHASYDQPEVIEKIVAIASETNAFGAVFTGRGYHIHYLLNKNIPIFYIKDIYIHMAMYFQNIIKEKIKEYELNKIFKVDPASKSYTQLSRTPGSINPKTGKLVRWVYQNTDNFIDYEKLLNVLILTKDDIKEPLLESIIAEFPEFNNAHIDSIEDFFSTEWMEKIVNHISLKVYGEEQNLTKGFNCVLHEEKHPSAYIMPRKGKASYSDFHLEYRQDPIIPNILGKYKNVFEVGLSYVLGKNVLMTRKATNEFIRILIDRAYIHNNSFKLEKEKVLDDIDNLMSLLHQKKLKNIKLYRTLETIRDAIIYKLNYGQDKFLFTQKWLASVSQTDPADASKILSLLTAVGLLKRVGIYKLNAKNQTNDRYLFTEISYETYMEEYQGSYCTYVYQYNFNANISKIANDIYSFFSKYKFKDIKLKVLQTFFSIKKMFFIPSNKRDKKNKKVKTSSNQPTRKHSEDFISKNFHFAMKELRKLLHPSVFFSSPPEPELEFVKQT